VRQIPVCYVRGSAALELALLLPVLLTLCLVVSELGRALYEYKTVLKAVGHGARYLATQAPNTQILETKNLVVYGNTEGTGATLAAGLSLGLVETPTWTADASDPKLNLVTVSVRGYAFKPLFSSVFGVSLGGIVFNEIRASMRVAS